jgi:hypothetical protein
LSKDCNCPEEKEKERRKKYVPEYLNYDGEIQIYEEEIDGQ